MSEQSCETRDLARGGSALLLWCLPFIALIVGLNWQTAQPMLWIPGIPGHGRGMYWQRCAMRQTALLRDGTCLFARGLYVALSALNLAPMRPGVFLFVVLGITAVACLAEGPFGKYKRKV